MKAFLKATDLDPHSVFSNYQIAIVMQKLGMFSQAIDQYNLTLSKAVELETADNLPSLKGLGDSYLALAKEYFVTGFYGRAAVAVSDGLQALLRAIKVHQKLQCLWKLIADLCFSARHFPNYLHLIDVRTVKEIIDNIDPAKIDASLHFPEGFDCLGLDIIRKLGDEQNASSWDALTCLLTCACVAYKYAIILNGKDRDSVGGYWYDLSCAYYSMHKNLSMQTEGNDGQLSSYLTMCIRCIKVALKYEPANFDFWNALGVVGLMANVKISQHAFIKSIEYSSKV
jgi:superkiller protein 3